MELPSAQMLKPLRLGELLDQAIRLYRNHFLTFIGIIALVYVPILVLQASFTAYTSTFLSGPGDVTLDVLLTDEYVRISFLLGLLFALMQFILVQGVATGALARAVGDNYLGRKTGILDAYRNIGRSWISLVGALLFIGLLILVALIWWIIIPCFGWFTGLGMMFFLSAAVVPLTAPAVVLEGQTSLNGVRRAWNLARRRFWPVLGYILVLFLFSLIVINGPTAIVNLLLTAVLPSFDDPSTYLIATTIVQTLVTLVSTLLYYPLQITAFVLIYFDLRVRTEGFDIALSTMEIDPNNMEQQMPAPPALTESLITWSDIGNFAIVTLGAIGLYFLLWAILFGLIMLFGVLFS